MESLRPSARKVCLLLVVSGAALAILIWFIPALTRATVTAPVHSDVGFRSHCVDTATPIPDYGSREPTASCE